MDKNYTIRQGSLKDIDMIMKVESECFEPGIRESQEIYESRLNLFPEGFLIVECDDGNIVGYFSSECWMLRNFHEYDFTLNVPIEKKHDRKGKMFYISSMGVLKAYRGKGIGKKLFNQAINFANKIKCSEAILIVGEPWTTAQTIYFKAGFEQVCIINNFFLPENSSPYNGIVMWRKL